MSKLDRDHRGRRLDELFYQRVRLNVELCRTLWRQHTIDREIRAALEASSSSAETRTELTRLLTWRAKRRLSGEQARGVESAGPVA